MVGRGFMRKKKDYYFFSYDRTIHSSRGKKMSVQAYIYFSVVYLGLYLFSTRVLRLVTDVAANFLSFTHSLFVVLFLGLCTTYDLNIEYLRCVSMVYFVMDTIMFQVPKKSWAFTIHHAISFILIQKYLNPYNPDVNNMTMEIFKHTYFWIELSNWPIYVVHDFHKYMQQYVHDIEQQLGYSRIYLILMQFELLCFERFDVRCFCIMSLLIPSWCQL